MENRLLRMLPPAEYKRLRPNFIKVSLALRQKVYEVNSPIRHVYFPLNGIISMVTVMKDGTRTEVATVGNEGMIGIPVFLGAKSVPGEAFSQIPGDAIRLDTTDFLIHLKDDGEFRAVLNRYAQVLMDHLAQSVSCNRLHTIQQRCSRWLLMTHDRVGKDSFPLTQEFLAQMLAVRRATVNEIATTLQNAGMIEYQRGNMTIKNRKKLESTSCECYRVIRDEYDRLIGELQ